VKVGLGHVAMAAAIAGAACSPIQPPTQTSIPMNSCPDNPCTKYVQSATTSCQQGACVVAAQITGMVLVVSLPQDSFFAPGRTFAIPFEHLFENGNAGCVQPTCARLPPADVVSGSYLIDPSVAMMVGWNLGNVSSGRPTALPLHATYVPLWGDAGAVATDQGLPLPPVIADSISNSQFGAYPGPGGGPGIAFSTYLAPGTYMRTLAPDPPFDQAYPPEIRQVKVATSSSADYSGLARQLFESDQVLEFEATAEEGAMKMQPTFDVVRPGGLDGWTAYLRDQTSGQVISSVRTLSGTKTTGVLLAENRVPPPPDALFNAELVLAPPSGAPVPSAVFVPLGGMLEPQVTYPPLPPPMVVQGSVATHEGIAVEADLVFEATGIVDGQNKLDTNGSYEFVGHTTATRDTTSSRALYSIALPLGAYRISIRPKDATGAVTIVDQHAAPFYQAFNVGVPGTTPNFDLVVDPPRMVNMRAVVADSRPLGGATIEAIPTSCYAGTQPWCLPRWVQTVSANDGSINHLLLDPGDYLIRARPFEGSRLPWATAFLEVPAVTFSGIIEVDCGTIVVPAPVSAGLQLVDWNMNPVVRAVVQVFTAPGQSVTPSPTCTNTMTAMTTQAAVEVGNAVTDSNGVFEMYLAPPKN